MKRIVTVVTFQYDFPDDEYPLDNLAVPAPSDDVQRVKWDRVGSAVDFYLDDQSTATILSHAVHEVAF